MTIRVLHIISGFAIEGPLGGIERFGIELAKSLDKDQIEPIVLGLWAYGTPTEWDWVKHLQERGIEAHMPADWDDSDPYGSFVRVYRAMRELDIQVDIVHSHCQFGDVAAALLYKKYGASKLIRTVHNEKEWGRRPARRLLLTNLLFPLLFDAEFGVAKQVIENLNARPIVRVLPKKRAVLLHNSINVQRFATATADRTSKLAEIGVPANADVVGLVGRLMPQKGYDNLLAAARLLLDARPNVYIIIIGNGHLEDELKATAQNLHLSDNVIFTGARNDVEVLLQCFDVFVNSSHWEGLPTAIMEAMAARVPVVATEVAGNSELIEDGRTGLLVPANDPQALAGAIGRMLETSADIRQAMTDNAYQQVADNFSIENIAIKHESLYRTLL